MSAHFDAAAGLPLHPIAREALLAALEDGWAEPGRLYGAGRRARILLDAAREAVAATLDARPDEISFVANGTQALQAATLGTLLGNRRAGRAFVHSAVEHSAILHCAEAHADGGGTNVVVGVDRFGRVDVDEFTRAVNGPGVAAAALQAANHEVGTTQPVDEIDTTVPLVVDATQTIAHRALPRSWSALAADARVWGGPSVGLLAVRTGVRWRSPYPSDEHEGGRVPGTPDLPSIVAAAASLRAVDAARAVESARQSALIDRLRAEIPRLVPDVEVLGDPDARLPHIVTFSCLYVDGESLLTGLDRAGFAVSSGSSCTSSTLEPSHVLVAMGALTSGNVRVSLHPGVSEQDITDFLAALPRVVADVRAELGADGL